MAPRARRVSLVGNRYSVEPALVGRRVELRFDPEDLGRIEVWHERRSYGAALPFVIGRHVHRQVPQAAPAPPPEPSGVDYLGLVEEQHDAVTLDRLSYRDDLIAAAADGKALVDDACAKKAVAEAISE